jgi:UDP-N-acetylmuramate dehydrogenase
MDLQEHAKVGSKTTMRIGGTARYFAELRTRTDVEEAVAFVKEKGLPMIVLGGGSNTIFTDGEVEALVVRIKAEETKIEGNRVTVEGGKILASLQNELATAGLDLSPLTGIPGTVGAAVFGNAGQGPKGIWTDTYVTEVTAYVDGAWKTYTKEGCHFRYRESLFKDLVARSSKLKAPPIVWSVTLNVPSGDPTAIRAEIERLIQQRIATQPHLKTAGSCFKAVGDVMAWKLIDAAGLRGYKVGGIAISEKHANFLLNVENGTYADAKALVAHVKKTIDIPLSVEIRFYEEDGSVAF